MADTTLQGVQETIATLGARWIAAETGLVAKRTEGNLFGVSLTEPQRVTLLEEAQKQVHAPMAPPPPKVDWRTGGWVTPVQDQQSCGACVAFSTVGALEARARIEQGDAGFHAQFSEAHLFSCGNGASCNGGWTVDAAMRFCNTTGVGERALFPYQPHDQPCTAIPPVVKIASHSKPVPPRARKTAVARGPVIACMKVFDDFIYYRSGIYSYTKGDLAGLHAVCVVGYDDDEQCWIVKNSWNTHWGEQGFFRMAYGQSMDTDFPFWEPKVVVLAAEA